ncbi:MAG TPA: hypothetical protein VMV03_12525 [Spirochaetia bacterium]|nr:hypothetical protein [Spirochaetia bacterium]
MWYTILITLVVDIAGLLLIYAILSDRVRRHTTASSQIAALRDEVSRLVVELNQTTERNVALVEDRLASLNEASAAADKKMGMLRRETEKHDVGAQVYSRLAEKSAAARAAARVSEAAPRAGEAGPRPAGAAPRAPEAGPPFAEGSPQTETAPGAADGGVSGSPRDTPRTGTDKGETQDARQRVMMLHRSGFPATLIASRVGMPVGEVELIISLEQRKGQG